MSTERTGKDVKPQSAAGIPQGSTTRGIVAFATIYLLKRFYCN